MNEHTRAWGPWQGRTTGPVIFMAGGILFLAVSTFLLATTRSQSGLLALLQALAIPSIPIGVMLFLLGLVNTTKNPSLRWLRRTGSILCGILLGLAVLWFLLILVLWISGF